MSTDSAPAAASAIRILVFVDYWNLQISMQEKHGCPYFFDWKKLPQWLCDQAAAAAQVSTYSYRGTRVYASYNPAGDGKLRGWMTSFLDRQPGVQVTLKPRRRKKHPKCPACHQAVVTCPKCLAPFAKTEEKGIDTAIVSDMVSLAWENTFDIGVLVSSDADFVPVAEFLDTKDKRIIQAGFPPQGKELATKCWASFDIYQGRDVLELVRPEPER